MSRSADQQRRRGFWMKQLHRWHWISAALCLIGMLLFAITGFTLNHAGQIESRPTVTDLSAQLPESLQRDLVGLSGADGDPLPAALVAWLEENLPVRLDGRAAEWLDNEIYLSLPRPGGDAWLSVRLDSGAVEYERTDRGWIALLNDLHKGRNTGAAWNGFIDVFAAACLVFCLTGLLLLQLHAGNRPATWPLVGLGFVAPLLLALLFIHS